MILNVIRAEDNINFVDNKNYILFIDNGNGTTSVNNNIFAVSDRIWIEEEKEFFESSQHDKFENE